MIEQGLYFTLGFCLASGLFMIFLPLLKARNIRLARARLETELPMSIEDILAERDQLRARFAVRERQMEQTIETLQTRMAMRAPVVTEKEKEKTTSAALQNHRSAGIDYDIEQVRGAIIDMGNKLVQLLPVHSGAPPA
jgi:hypothetical protein